MSFHTSNMSQASCCLAARHHEVLPLSRSRFLSVQHLWVVWNTLWLHDNSVICTAAFVWIRKCTVQTFWQPLLLTVNHVCACVCVRVWKRERETEREEESERKELRGGGQVQGERREEAPSEARWQGACIFSSPWLNPSAFSWPQCLGASLGSTDGQHVEGKRRGYDLFPCGEKSMGCGEAGLNGSVVECDPDLQPMPSQSCFN